MINKMYATMDNACKKASGLTLFGVLSPYKWTILLGSLGITGSITQALAFLVYYKYYKNQYS
ncbi:hypothetical protein AN957_00935 [Cytobacillus solani]|uniref:Uncharacterized protein n=1 Tax=Cytobacillus solani TaxID=1637975 RepID=A0A0Q3RBD5_9BACI|nr:hypothetical protein AN957_00935 [Cytobacillus solani]